MSFKENHTILIYWLFHVPLRVGCSPVCCVAGLMAFLHITCQAKAQTFLQSSLLTKSFYLNFGLPQEVGPSTRKSIIFFVNDVSSS